MEEGKKDFVVFELPPLLWMGVIFCLSSIPGRYIPSSLLFHQIGHFIEYFVFGVLLARGLAHLKIKLNAVSLSLLSVFLVVLFAFFDEWRQGFVPGRVRDFTTVFFDAVYALFGIFLYEEFVFKLFRKKKGPEGRSS
jgi:VanZ family protein